MHIWLNLKQTFLITRSRRWGHTYTKRRSRAPGQCWSLCLPDTEGTSSGGGSVRTSGPPRGKLRAAVQRPHLYVKHNIKKEQFIELRCRFIIKNSNWHVMTHNWLTLPVCTNTFALTVRCQKFDFFFLGYIRSSFIRKVNTDILTLLIKLLKLIFLEGGVLLTLLDLRLVALGIPRLAGETLGVDVRIAWICG